jgi:segregation and condensation protein B
MNLAALEAILFSTGEVLTLEQIMNVFSVSEEEAKEAILALTEQIKARDGGVEVIKVNNGYQLRTKPEFGELILKLREQKPRKLSNAALETLAVVAYRQPVTKHDIDTIRGVDVGPTLKTLLERELIQVIGQKPTVGNPSLYATTDKFLELFGINSLSELPNLREVREIEEHELG